MKAIIDGTIINYTDVNVLAKKIITLKMNEEGCKTFTNYMNGWVDCMDEIESQSQGESFVPFTIETVMDIAVDSLENEIGVVEGNTAYLGRSPEGFAEAIERIINEGLVAEK